MLQQQRLNNRGEKYVIGPTGTPLTLNDLPPAKSWNSSHATQGCSLEALKKTGGGGLMYCFAAN